MLGRLNTSIDLIYERHCEPCKKQGEAIQNIIYACFSKGFQVALDCFASLAMTYSIALTALLLVGCSSIADSEIIMRANSENRKQQKPNYMPSEEKPVENHSPVKKTLPIAPQLGIRIPLEK